jgi:protein-S-isoprenylcysteine O-methyltransferase Ste14
VAGFALLYWFGVWAFARRVRRHIGRSPNLRPRGRKESVLWLGWCLVVVGWIGQAFFVRPDATTGWVTVGRACLEPAGMAAGLLLTVAGYAGTLWCYAAMGDAWRIGVNREEKTALVTCGPYRWIRHPIYAFQVLLLAGAAALLPTVLSVAILAIHLVCVRFKAADEEAHLLALHGESYRDYLRRTGRLLPRLG